ncbi:hypothetical protein RJ640_027716 [Escallonia rubra]|uniref:Nuclear transcription factor Y subunit n=1 Tax=Escallonia rubra TaxID=112253 RepID=A0AA88QEL6_9ASTE|nr:hypothetical protein RJ640_027716 [Escallonia rubra]
MQSKPDTTNRIEDTYKITPSALYPEPWWRNNGYVSNSPAVMHGNASDSSSVERSIDGQSQCDSGRNEEDDDASKESQLSAPDGDHRQDQNVHLSQPPQLELVGHSIACASNPYYTPYYGGMMAAYGQPLVHPHLLDMHHARMPLPLEMAEEPVYVNAKQYHGILRRRQSRAKAELEKKLIKDRKPYLHESRHQHAMRRERGTGGRFTKKADDDDAKKHTAEKKGRGSTQSTSSSGSEPVPSSSADNLVHEACKVQNFVKDGDRYENQGSFHRTYESHSVNRDDGGSVGQQWASVPSNQAQQRAVAMQ